MGLKNYGAKNMKILHTSDVHLGRRPVGGKGSFSNKRFEDYFKAFANIVDTAIEENVDVMVIAGDFFDRRELSPDVLSKTEQILENLVRNNIPLLVTEGNHDNIPDGEEHESWIIYLEKKRCLKRLTYRLTDDGYEFEPYQIGDINFYGLGYPGGFVNETLTAFSEFIENRNSDKNYLLVHTAIASSEFLPGTVEKATIDLLRDKVIYIAGGHFHSHQVYPLKSPYFFLPGSPEYWELSEKKSGKGFIIFDSENRDFRFIPSKLRNKIEIEIRSSAINEEQFKDEFAEKTSSLSISEEDIIVINITVEKAFYIDSLWCENKIMEHNPLKAIVKVEYKGERKEIGTHSMKGTREIEEDIISGWDLFSQKSMETISLFQKLKIYQKEDKREIFFEAFDSMLEIFVSGDKDEA